MNNRKTLVLTSKIDGPPSLPRHVGVMEEGPRVRWTPEEWAKIDSAAAEVVRLYEMKAALLPAPRNSLSWIKVPPAESRTIRR